MYFSHFIATLVVKAGYTLFDRVYSIKTARTYAIETPIYKLILYYKFYMILLMI